MRPGGVKNKVQMDCKFLLAVFCIFFVSLAFADVISVNPGGSNVSVLNPSSEIEGFLFLSNQKPVASNVILNSTSGLNLTSDNLTVYYSSTDADGNNLTNITDWRVNGGSIALVNMPFDKNVIELTEGAVRDYSTYENNGTLGGGNGINAPDWNFSGVSGGSYYFDGDGDFLNTSWFDLTCNKTVSLWVYAESDVDYGALISTRGVSSPSNVQGWAIRLNQYSETISMYHVGGTNVISNEDFSSYMNKWTHIVWKFDTVNGHQVWFDGVNLYNNSATSCATASNYELRLGISGGSHDFKGYLDEVLLFNRSLSSEQIQNIYQAGLEGHQVEKMSSSETSKGDTWQVALTPNDKIIDGDTVLSNSLSIENYAPEDPTGVTLFSLNGRNESDTDLNCSAYIEDIDNTNLDVNVNWINNSVSFLNETFTGESNGTVFSATLGNGNLTLGDTWVCSVRTFDGGTYSNWIDSNNLTIVDITSPNITIISPNSTYNYTTLDVDFNVSVEENENVSVCLYSLDFQPNVTMNELNDSYFWFEPSLGPGPHYLDYFCNDTSNNWGHNSTNFTILNSAAIAILLSDNLTSSIKWNVESLPVNDLDAEGNNFNSSTYYYINVSATNTFVDLYVKADGDLYTAGLDVIGLGNETFAVNTTNSTVPNPNKTVMSTNYTLIGDALGDNSVVYMKFYLDAPAGQPAGIYLNTLSFKAVRDGETP